MRRAPALCRHRRRCLPLHDEFWTSSAQEPIFRFGSRAWCRRSEASVLGSTVGIVEFRRVGARYRNTSELPDNGLRSAPKLTR